MIQWLKDLLGAAVQPQALVDDGTARTTSARAEQGETLAKQLALVIDLNVCVGCHACVTSCKEWNSSGSAGPLVDESPYGANPTGTFFNRVQTYEAGAFPQTQTVHFPKSCLHCEDPPCVPVCPTGARLFGDVKDPDSEVSRAVRERGGYALMPEWETQPANKYLPRRITTAQTQGLAQPSAQASSQGQEGHA